MLFSARLKCSRVCQDCSMVKKTMGPRRPTNMSIMTTNFPGAESLGVSPVLNPTVPKAEDASKNSSMNLPRTR